MEMVWTADYYNYFRLNEQCFLAANEWQLDGCDAVQYWAAPVVEYAGYCHVADVVKQSSHPESDVPE